MNRLVCAVRSRRTARLALDAPTHRRRARARVAPSSVARIRPFWDAQKTDVSRMGLGVDSRTVKPCNLAKRKGNAVRARRSVAVAGIRRARDVER